MQPSPFSPPRPPFGAILAGGASSRFGAAKALARVGGVPIVQRVNGALRAAAGEVVLIANQPELFDGMGFRVRGDRVRGAGPLAGIHAALHWAREEGRPGALCVACDLPFVPAALLARLLEVAAGSGADAVVPESPGRRGVEPLCAFYSVRAAGVLGAMLLAGERRAAALLAGITAERIPLDEVRRFADPAVGFLNVNTPADYHAALRVAGAAEPG